MNKTRLDVLLVERGLIPSREQAKAIIMSGDVFIRGTRADKPGMQVQTDASIEVRSMPEYVSRGGTKLEKALAFFGVSPEGKVCLDCGASTGGFTDCLLKNGAKLVYAVDVGYGQLAWSLRSDSRVIVMERTNIRNLTTDSLKERPGLVVIDVSFISLGLVLPVVRQLLTEEAEVICLVKPQFEAGRDKVGKKGVVRDPDTHIEVLNSYIINAEKAGFSVKGLTHSPVKGPEGNIEYLGHLCCGEKRAQIDITAIVMNSHKELLDEKNNTLSEQ